MVPLAAGIFLAGLGFSFAALYRFEHTVRVQRRLDRLAVGRALRLLIAAGLASGLGMALLGLTGFFGARTTAPGPAAYAWAALFAGVALLGWPAILVAAFMARVNALRRRVGKR